MSAPPIGLIPLSIHRQKRAAEIVAAMDRYVQASKKIPLAWLKELTEIYSDAAL